MNVEEIMTKDKLYDLKQSNTIAIEGLSFDHFNDFILWAKACNAEISNNKIYFIKGKTINKLLSLHGNNAYPENINIVSVICNKIGNIPLAKTMVGAKWMNEII